MKTIVFCVVTAVVGAAVGIASTQFELPEKPSPAVPYLNAVANSRASSESKTGPRLVVVNGELHDFGRMDRLSKMTHAFIVRNDGDAPLTLEKGSTSCKCTVSDLKDNSLPPGEQTEVVLEWSAKTEDTEFSQTAELLTNDPARRKVTLRVKGLVIEAVRADRTHVGFGSIARSEPIPGRMKIYGFHDDQPLEIVSHEWVKPERADYFTASFRPLAEDELDTSIGAKSGVEMTLKPKSGLPFGPVDQTIRLAVNYDVPPIEIPIHGRVVGDITFIGPKFRGDFNLLSLGAVKRDQGAKVTLRGLVKGSHRDDVQFEVESVEPAEALHVEVGQPSSDANVITIPVTVEVRKDAAPVSRLGNADSKAGKIVLKTTHPELEKIEIEVRFAVQP
jgi:hypothetical protein